jgi:4-azaleucine resistance transporter AzlC
MGEEKGFKKGLINSFPIVIGYFPVAITFGITGIAMGFSKLEVILMSLFVFAGASQFTLIALLPGSFVSGVVIPILLNLRHLIYGSIVIQKFKLSKSKLIPFFLTDEVFATAINSSFSDKYYLLGLGLGAYFSWVFGTIVGCLCGELIFSKKLFASLTFSLTALFLLLLISNLKGKGKLAAVIGGVTGLLFKWLGNPSLGILVAGLISPITISKLKS